MLSIRFIEPGPLRTTPPTAASCKLFGSPSLFFGLFSLSLFLGGQDAFWLPTLPHVMCAKAMCFTRLA